MFLKNTCKRLLALFLCILCLSPYALAIEDPAIRAKSSILADPETGQVFYEVNADEKAIPRQRPRS